MQRLTQSLLFAFVLISGLVTPAATAGREAEMFAGGLLDQTVMILRDTSLGEAARTDRLHQLVMQHLDARKGALFALGAYQRQVDPAAVNEYIHTFTDYITALYEARLRTFRSFEFKIVASQDAGQGDINVITQARSTFERRSGGPIYIWLRLTPNGGQYKIVDVQIAGMWVSIYAREQFGRILSENRADLRALTSYLAFQAAQIRGGNNGQVASR